MRCASSISGASHAALTSEYASIPQEMGAVARAVWQAGAARGGSGAGAYQSLPQLREKLGDRAVLRAHALLRETISGLSERPTHWQAATWTPSWRWCGSRAAPPGSFCRTLPRPARCAEQAMAVALAIAERALDGQRRLPCTWRRLCRNHPGVCSAGPLRETFRQEVESMLGAGCCHMLSIRPVGGAVLWP